MLSAIPEMQQEQPVKIPAIQEPNSELNVTETGNIMLLNLSKLERSFPALKPIVTQLQIAVIKAEATTPRQRVLSAVGAIFMTLLLRKNHVFGTQFMVTIGALYSTLKALNNPQTDDYDRWLCFWSIFGASSLSDWFIKSKSYHYLKVVLFYWLSKDGSLYIYRKLLNRLAILKNK